MKLLIITQKVDRTDPILGFFHRWIEEFAAHCEEVTVIGQYVADFDLPKNVHIESLNKEKGLPTWKQVIRFWLLQWKLRKQYDTVFVHMTPIWVVLGWKTWFVLRKPVYLWYEVKRGGTTLKMAQIFVRNIFSATVQGMPWTSAKQVVVGHGIDTVQFNSLPVDVQKENRVMATGRITPIKNYNLLLKSFAKLQSDAHFFIAGCTYTDADREEKKKLDALEHKLNIADRVHMEKVLHRDMPRLLQASRLFLHASQGGLDKALLEAMACGCPVVSTSTAAHGVLPGKSSADNDSITAKAEYLLSLSAEESHVYGQMLRAIVVEHHSISNCISRMCEEMSPHPNPPPLLYR